MNSPNNPPNPPPSVMGHDVSLIEQLRRIPLDARLIYDWGTHVGSSAWPIGQMAHDAADAIEAAGTAQPPPHTGLTDVERVARAIYEANPTLANVADLIEPARAAIAAMQPTGQVTDDVRRLVIAARTVAFEGQSPEALRELDQASEAFASRIPWEHGDEILDILDTVDPAWADAGQVTDEVERVARAIFDSHNATYTAGGPAKWESDPEHWRRYALAALLVSNRSGVEDGFYEGRFFVATVSEDGREIGLDHPTDADWNAVRRAHIALRDRLNERLAQEDMCPHKSALDTEKEKGR